MWPSIPFWFLLKEKQTSIGEREGEKKGRWVANSYMWHPFVSLMEEKTDRARRDIWGGWSTPTCGPPLFLLILRERQTGLGETYGVDGQFLHVALYSFFDPPDRTQTARRENGRCVANSCMLPRSLFELKLAARGRFDRDIPVIPARSNYLSESWDLTFFQMMEEPPPDGWVHRINREGKDRKSTG